MVTLEVGDLVQYWLGLPTVKATVIGFGRDDQIILRQVYTGFNHNTGKVEEIKEICYRDRQFIEALNTGPAC